MLELYGRREGGEAREHEGSDEPWQTVAAPDPDI